MPKCNKRHNKKIAFMRLKRNKGSVLFLVVAIMSVMVILASAVYYSVTSARKQIVIKYDSEQSYQSALALNDMITDYIGVKTSDSFVVSIIGLNENDELVTTSDDGSGFSELAAGLGDFKVTVKKIKGNAGDAVNVLEITTEVQVGGENSVVTTVGEFSLQAKAYTFDRFFTSTGYAPNDVIFNGIKSGSTMYLDNEFTQYGSNSGGDLTVNGELISAGSVAFYNPTQFVKPNDMTIGNNAYFFGMNGSFNVKTVRVGGSVVIPNGLNQNLIDTATLYIMEDFYFGNQSGGKKYVNGDLVWDGQNPPGGSLYVNGDMFIDKDRDIYQIPQVYVGGNIYIYSDNDPVRNNSLLDGKVKSLGGKIYNLKNSRAYSFDRTSQQFTTPSYFDASKIAFSVTQTGCESLDSMRSKMDYIEAFCGNLGGGYTYIWPSNDDTSDCESLAMVKAMIDEKIGNPSYINWNAESLFIETVMENGVVTKRYKTDERIQYINMNVGNNEVKVIKPYVYETQGNGSTRKVIKNRIVIDDISFGGGKCGLVFDTSDGEGGYEDIYVYLEPNCYNEDGSTQISNAGQLGNNSFMWCKNGVNNAAQILTTGKGSVIFVVPDGVKYIQNAGSFIGHIGIFEMANNTTVAVSERNGEKTYTLNMDRAIAGGGFNQNLIGDHLNPNYNKITQDGLLSQDVINNGINKGYYTHNNIFIATVSKNARMDFTAAQNQCCAFIYAPYMTYDPSGVFGSSENGMLGGMIVSDYMMAPVNNYYIGTVPYDYYDRFVTATDEEQKEEERSKYMEKLMSDSGFSTHLESSTTKSWKKYGYN